MPMVRKLTPEEVEALEHKGDNARAEYDSFSRSLLARADGVWTEGHMDRRSTHRLQLACS